MAKELLQPQDKYVLRMPDGLRDRIKKSAERNGRSMNAEMVAALSDAFPEEPSVADLLDKVHEAILLAQSPSDIPYRKPLIAALDELSQRVASGLEFDQFRPGTNSPFMREFVDHASRYNRWRRAGDEGVDQSDLERELGKGMFELVSRERMHTAIYCFRNKKPEKALKALGLGNTKFAKPEAAYSAIEKNIRQTYTDNWDADPDESAADMIKDE